MEGLHEVSMDDEECKDLHNDETEDYTISPNEDRNRKSLT